MSQERKIRHAALVTGGAVRLGKSICLALAQNGFDIALHYNHSEAKAHETAAEIKRLGVRCEVFRAELSEASQLPNLISDVFDKLPHFNMLINSASGYLQSTIAETSTAVFDKMMEVNLRAPFFLMQAFAKKCQDGHIINILDNKIAFNQFDYAAYLLSKKALAELTRMAAIEFSPGIRVNAVAPGVILPAVTRSDDYIEWRVIEGIPLKRKGEPENITRAIMHLHENDFMNGQIIMVDGGESLTNTGLNAANYDQDKI